MFLTIQRKCLFFIINGMNQKDSLKNNFLNFAKRNKKKIFLAGGKYRSTKCY